MTGPAAALWLLLLPAQIAGHGTVPTTGAAARDAARPTPREQDPVTERVERLRDELRGLERAHRRRPAAERRAADPDLARALDELLARVRAPREAVPEG